MARMVNRQRPVPPMEVQTNNVFKNAEFSRAGHTSNRPNEMSSPTYQSARSVHGVALGRGHESVKTIERHETPFLDSSYFVPKKFSKQSTSSFGATQMSIESVHSFQSKSSSNQNDFIYLRIGLIVHEDDKEISKIPTKVLGFSSGYSIHQVMHEVCSYLDADFVKPLYMLNAKSGKKIHEGIQIDQIEADQIEFELHVYRIEGATKKLQTEVSFTKSLRSYTLYMCMIVFNTEKQVLTFGGNNILPCIPLSTDPVFVDGFTECSPGFIWAKSRSMDWEKSATDLLNLGVEEQFVFKPDILDKNQFSFEQALKYNKKENLETLLKFKSKFYEAGHVFYEDLYTNKMGFLYPKVVELSNVQGAKLMISVQFSSHQLDNEFLKKRGLKWRHPRHLNQNFHNISDDPIWGTFIQFYQRHRYTLAPGLYVGLLNIRNTVETTQILVPKHNPEIIPIVKIRSSSQHANNATPYLSPSSPDTENSNRLSQLEWEFLNILANPKDPKFIKTRHLYANDPKLDLLGKQTLNAVAKLRQEVGIDDIEISRLSQLGPVILNNEVTILVLDLQRGSRRIHAKKEKKEEKRGMFSKFMNGGSKSGRKSSISHLLESDDEMEQINLNKFSYIPIGLFELLHHNQFKHVDYSVFRRELEKLEMHHMHLETRSNASKQPAPSEELQMIVCSTQELKKKWNSSYSWVVKMMENYRAKQLKQMGL